MEANGKNGSKRTFVPACSIAEDGGIVTVKLEMPGVAKDALKIKIEGNELSVYGERGPDVQDGRYLLRERKAEAYRKLFTLDDSIAHDAVDAALADGTLTLKLRVKESAKPRRIEIR